jgi:hypothetical protein
MLTMLQIIHLNPGLAAVEQDRLLALLNETSRALPGVRSAVAGKTLPRALNGGQIMWRVAFATEQDYWNCLSSTQWQGKIAPALAPARGILVESVAYATPFSDTSQKRSHAGIWRCLVFAVEPRATTAEVRQFESDLLLMPGLVKVIKNWTLSRVVATQGRRAWTHVWEQEFDDVSGLEGEYMTHPIHWGLVDGWFDPECPQRIVDPFLIHAAMPIQASIIV